MTGFRIASAAFAVALGFGSAASAQVLPPGAPAPAGAASALTAAQVAAIDKIAATVIERKATPSVAIGVAKNGRLIFAKAYGYRNLDDRVPADAETMYGIGSNTKQFTAAAIMMLRDQGKIDVDAPVSRYLPGIPHGGEVKIRNLLTHTGGYAEYTELPDIDMIGARPATNQEILDSVVSRPLGFKPGTKWQYSNTGYVMLATIVEKLSGMSYPEFLRTKIFEPLGMTRTHFGDEQLVETDRATGYTRFAMGEQEHEQHLDYSWFSGAGAIESTLADMERWNDAIDRGSLLSASSREMMHTSFKLADGSDTSYGFGLFLRTLPGGKHVVLHGGDTTGFGTQDARFVEDGIDVIVLTNQEPASYNAVLNAVYGAIVAAPPRPLPTSTPAPTGPAPATAANPAPAQPAVPAATPSAGPSASPTPIPYAKPEVDALARRWLDDAIVGKIDLTKLSAGSRASLRLPRYQAALRDLARFGPRTYRLVNVDRRAPSSSYQYLMLTPTRTLIYIFGIDDDGLISGGDVFDPNPLAPDRPAAPPAATSPAPSPSPSP
ncbi:MAG TPA: serine hydrolase domain-containing protein [Candidatus Limnocylindrales bacterium]|nr:serine hydrolase domain-containing protein [Candidatus Limnocylindrales bacterium]